MCRFLRWLSQAEGVAVTMDPADWSVATQAGLLAAGIRTRNEAMEACAALTAAYAASGAQYTLADLSVFACLRARTMCGWKYARADVNISADPPAVRKQTCDNCLPALRASLA